MFFSANGEILSIWCKVQIWKLEKHVIKVRSLMWCWTNLMIERAPKIAKWQLYGHGINDLSLLRPVKNQKTLVNVRTSRCNFLRLLRPFSVLQLIGSPVCGHLHWHDRHSLLLPCNLTKLKYRLPVFFLMLFPEIVEDVSCNWPIRKWSNCLNMYLRSMWPIERLWNGLCRLGKVGALCEHRAVAPTLWNILVQFLQQKLPAAL